MVSVTMPQLGESVIEGTITRWLKRQGERVAKYEPLVEVITDKVNSEIPSPEGGVVARIVVPEGETVKVGTEIAVIETESPHPLTPAPTRREGETRPAERSSEAGAAAGSSRYSDEELRQRSSPLVRRLAKEHAIDLRQVSGTGTSGRVTKEDILAFIERRRSAPGEAPLAVEEPAPTSGVEAASVIEEPTDEEVLPVSPVRRMIAEHMVRSVATAPHAWTYVEVDVSGLVKWREAARAEFERREGFALSYVPFVVRALVEALREHPGMNSTWRDGRVVLKKRIHLGIAVALEDGLLVPVIKDADEKSVTGLARALHDLVGRARAGRLSPDDVQGGTFTLNNTGALGSILSMPIINQPQAAILTMEAIARRVVVTGDDAIAIRSMMNVCLSFDHRVCDGGQASRFLQSLKRRLEALGPGGALS